MTGGYLRIRGEDKIRYFLYYCSVVARVNKTRLDRRETNMASTFTPPHTPGETLIHTFWGWNWCHLYNIYTIKSPSHPPSFLSPDETGHDTNQASQTSACGFSLSQIESFTNLSSYWWKIKKTLPLKHLSLWWQKEYQHYLQKVCHVMPAQINFISNSVAWHDFHWPVWQLIHQVI